MAPANPTLLDTVSATTTSNTITSATLSPAGNALLIVSLAAGLASEAALEDFTISDTFSPNLTWTRRHTEVNRSTNTSAMVVFTAVTGPTPGTGTVTVLGNASSNRRVLKTSQIASGFNTSAPVTQAGGNNNNTGPTTLAITLGAGPAADSLVMGFVGSRSATDITAGGQFTELSESSSGGGGATFHQIQYDATSPTTTVDWSTLGAANNAGAALEIAAEAAGQPAARRFGISQFMRPVEMGRKGVRIT